MNCTPLNGTYTLLNSMSRPTTENGSTDWLQFSYGDNNGFQVITQVKYPEGAQEDIFYEVGGHLYQSNGVTYHTPRVTQYIYSPGAEQPDMSEVYEYPEDGYNYLGYPNDNG